MAWIESHQKLEKSGKLLLLSELLRINKYQAIGHLHSLWWWCLDNAEDGDVTRFSAVTLGRVTGWSDFVKEVFIPGFPRNEESFFKACLQAGFIDKAGKRHIVHNWQEYTDRYFKMLENTRRNREQTRERVRQFRERHGNADVTPLRNAHETPGNAPTKPNLTKPYQTKRIKPPDDSPPLEKVKRLDYVWLTSDEWVRLSERMGMKNLTAFIERLNGYIGQIGEKKAAAKYRSHYHTILNWYRRDLDDGKIRPPAVLTPIPARPAEKELTDEERAEGARVMAEAKQILKVRTIPK